MNTNILWAIPMWAFGLTTSALDYYVSVQGIKQGLAEEGNWIVRMIYGGKPNALQLLAALLPQDVAALAAATVLFNLGHPGLIGLGFGIVLALMGRHASNVLQWKKLGVKLQ